VTIKNDDSTRSVETPAPPSDVHAPTVRAHTRGPWEVHYYNPKLVRPSFFIQQHVPGAALDDEQLEADARLISAAPELLAALKDMVHVFTDIKGESDYEREALRIGNAAIAKAEGR
jgi:hypothetical protein